MIFLGILGILAVTVAVLTTTDLRIGTNYEDSVMAFQDAESGIHYTLGKLKADLGAGEIALPSSVGDSISLPYTAPTGFTFSISSLEMSDSNRYTFTSTGNGPKSSQAVIEAAPERPSAFSYGLSGDEKVEIKENTDIYSYDHETNPSLAPEDSTGEGDVGSNGYMELKENVMIDGDAALGDDGSGTEAGIEIKSGVTISGESGVDVERAEPDPLGVVGGEYAAKFTTYSASNDNSLASPAVGGTEINLDVGESITLSGKPGGANYYLTEIEIKEGGRLPLTQRPVRSTSFSPVRWR